ncbi:hypothetical protein NDA01_31370 [Trichocoleus desertorum AS-A10]|uniref:hypothetical protein n=1 Tax=Trichocoleus desertorum TaxID=1481672 RepID=UPI0032976763
MHSVVSTIGGVYRLVLSGANTAMMNLYPFLEPVVPVQLTRLMAAPRTEPPLESGDRL